MASFIDYRLLPDPPAPFVILILGVLLSFPASGTWSIVAVDPETGQVGLAAATCNIGINFIADAVPRSGVVVAQAATSFKGRDQARKWIEQGLGANEVLHRLSQPEFYDGWFDTEFSELQYGVATLTPSIQAGFTSGGDVPQWSGGISGAHFSVQGNTLRSGQVISAAAKAFEAREVGTCRLSFGERLLRALEAGRDAGGDRRCPVHKPAYSAILLISDIQRDPPHGPTSTLRIVAPFEIGALRGLFYQLVPYEPDSRSAEPVSQLRNRYRAAGGRRCR